MTNCNSLCKYYDERDGCIFFSMGSGYVEDMPCHIERDNQMHNKGFEDAKIKIFEKLEHTKPEYGEDGSKERYRYLQWLSDWNAVVEAIGGR